jgi:hypothetical protein
MIKLTAAQLTKFVKVVTRASYNAIISDAAAYFQVDVADVAIVEYKNPSNVAYVQIGVRGSAANVRTYGIVKYRSCWLGHSGYVFTAGGKLVQPVAPKVDDEGRLIDQCEQSAPVADVAPEAQTIPAYPVPKNAYAVEINADSVTVFAPLEGDFYGTASHLATNYSGVDVERGLRWALRDVDTVHVLIGADRPNVEAFIASLARIVARFDAVTYRPLPAVEPAYDLAPLAQLTPDQQANAIRRYARSAGFNVATVRNSPNMQAKAFAEYRIYVLQQPAAVVLKYYDLTPSTPAAI